MDNHREVQPQDMRNLDSLHFDFYIPGCYNCALHCTLMNDSQATEILHFLNWYIEDLWKIHQRYKVIE